MSLFSKPNLDSDVEVFTFITTRVLQALEWVEGEVRIMEYKEIFHNSEKVYPTHSDDGRRIVRYGKRYFLCVAEREYKYDSCLGPWLIKLVTESMGQMTNAELEAIVEYEKSLPTS